jgi:predicted nuclease of predicted toxin-antitoxin system
MKFLIDTCGWLEWLTDSIIYATAQQENVKLITSDNHFEGLPDVIYFSKKS